MDDRLSNFPWVVVRIGCRTCRRRGSYRLARLAAKFGPDAPMDHVLEALTVDCAVRDDRRGRRRDDEGVCRARYVDLDQTPPPPPDLPPALRPPVDRKLRVVIGGKGGG
jgi:hypothetical protein